MKNILLLILGLIMGFAIDAWLQPHKGSGTAEMTRDTIWDTIAFYQPIPKDSMVLRYQTIALPLAKLGNEMPDSCPDQENMGAITAFLDRDSVQLEIPITQKHYTDTAYEAWVSGWQPSLDSLKVFPRTIRTTETIHARPKRWGLGISAGAAMTPRGAEPYIGIGIHYSIAAF